MPLPADVDDFKMPPFSVQSLSAKLKGTASWKREGLLEKNPSSWKVLMKLVNNRSPEEALKHLKEKEPFRPWQDSAADAAVKIA